MTKTKNQTQTAFRARRFSVQSVVLALGWLGLAILASQPALNNAQADAFADDVPASVAETVEAVERCILAPQAARDPGTGAAILVLRTSC